MIRVILNLIQDLFYYAYRFRIESGMTFIPALILLIISLIFVRPVFAIESPILSSPANETTVSSSSLQWSSVDGASEYRIIVDDSNPPSSPYLKSTYPTSTKYTPQLDPGTYYWEVEARDGSGNWSAWSNVWSFTLSASEPTSNPTATNPTATPKPSNPTSAFIVSGVPTAINSNQSFSAQVDLNLPNNPNSQFFLKGAFQKSDSSNYFGLTRINGSWVKNGSGYSNQLSVHTDSSGHWSGNLEIMPDDNDSGFQGSGSYILKVGRYSSSGSGPTWSNEINLNINAIEPSQTATTTKTSTTATNKPTSQTLESLKNPAKNIEYQIASVAGISTASATPSATQNEKAKTKVLENRQFNWLPFLGGGLVIIGLGSIIYIFVKARYNHD